jgi:hypothetical protein
MTTFLHGYTWPDWSDDEREELDKIFGAMSEKGRALLCYAALRRCARENLPAKMAVQMRVFRVRTCVQLPVSTRNYKSMFIMRLNILL